MRLVFVGGPLVGVAIFAAHMLALFLLRPLLGDGIVTPRLSWHVKLQVVCALPFCVLYAPIIVALVAVIAERNKKSLSSLRCALASLGAGFVFFLAAYAQMGSWETVPGALNQFPWVWIGAFALAAVAMFFTARPDETTTSLWASFRQSLTERPVWIISIAAGLLVLGLVLAWNHPTLLTLLILLGFFAVVIFCLASVAVANLNARIKRRWIPTLATLAIFIAGALAVFLSAMVAGGIGNADLWTNLDAAIVMAQDFGGLASLPPSARALDGTVVGSMFTHPVFLRFIADPEDIDRWLASSPGLEEKPPDPFPSHLDYGGPLWAPEEFGTHFRLFHADGNGNGGYVIVNDDTHTVFVDVSWS
ncbi:MAG: hypothetical protein P9L99_07565 [Candidatus Lernaella stagnicola]|nr:hypothetical protein [Candidatus Lernaella stagnicola]